MKSSRAFRNIAVLGTVLLFGIIASGISGEGDWAYWRGPDSDGMARGDAPLNWSDTENVRWKIPVPGLGQSSPVLWGDRIFITTAIQTGSAPKKEPAPKSGRGGFNMAAQGPQAEHKFDVLCIDRKTGEILWQRTATTAAPHEGFHGQYGSFASNSPVTDGRHVYAFFGSRGIYCYDMDGNLLWGKDFGVKMRMRMAFGEGMAPVLSGDRLILVFDHEEDSFMVVLDKNSGKEIWKVARDEGSEWAAPLVVEYEGRKQIITNGTNKVRSYDFNSGEVIWECGGLGANPIPAPVRQDDLVFVMTGFMNPNLMAIRLGGTGDLTGTDYIVWNQTRGNSYTASPVLFENKLYVLTDDAKFSCYNARTGEPYYHQERLPGVFSFKSSPVGANGKLYIASENGVVLVLKMGEKFEVLATNTMPDQMFVATPAISDGEIFLRSQTQLFCIGNQ